MALNHDPGLTTRASRVMARCDRLAACTEESGAIVRSYGSAALVEAMVLVEGWMREAGIETRRDAVGNLLGRLPGPDPEAAALVLGSHLDSVRDAGRYDGPLGVLVALDAVAQVALSGRRQPVALEVAAFADEEGLRFHTAYLGSSGYVGSLDRALLELVDASGVSLRDACLAIGGDPETLSAGAPPPTGLEGYVEVHIEQGPALERLGAPLAVVSAIAGQSRVGGTFTGEAGHAGTVPMDERHDALLGAAELALAAEALASAVPGLIATVGELDVFPGASNVIPGAVRFSLDVRAPDDRTRQTAVKTLHRRARAIAAQRGLDLSWQVVQGNPAVPMDATLSSRLEAAVDAVGFAVHHLPSGAGHDAVVLAQVCPVAMLFVRCTGGISHNPAEAVLAEDVAAALAVLDRFLAAPAEEGSRRERTTAT